MKTMIKKFLESDNDIVIVIQVLLSIFFFIAFLAIIIPPIAWAFFKVVVFISELYGAYLSIFIGA